MKAGIQHHVLDYLLKPVDHTQLEHILDILVQRLLERPHSTNDDAAYHTAFQPLLKLITMTIMSIKFCLKSSNIITRK